MKNKIGEGMVSDAYMLDEKRIILVGKREDSFESYKRLKTNLDLLNGKIKSLKIPSKAEIFSPCKEYPFGAISFIYISGSELKNSVANCNENQKKLIGKQLAKFIYEMQSLNIIQNKQKEIDINNEKFRNSLVLIEPYLNGEENEQLKKVAISYNLFMKNSKFVMTHGDLQEENLIVDKQNNLVGIIDFGNMEYYVSEVEFFPMMDYDQVIFESMVENYEGDLSITNIYLVGLVRQIRFFKHVQNWSNFAKQNEIIKIKKLLINYSNFAIKQ